MTALKDRIQTAANSVKTGKALIENSIVSKGGSVTKVNPIPTFAELCGGVNNLYKIKITVSRETITFPELGGVIEVTIDSSTVVEVTVPDGVTIQSNQYPFMGDPKRSYGTTKYVFCRQGWVENVQYLKNIVIRALVNDASINKTISCIQPLAPVIPHGFEYTPGQADDRVDYIGNMALNQSKPIQSAMRPFEMKTDGTDRANLQDNVKLRVNGSISHLTDSSYLQQVSIPEFWYGSTYDKVRNKNQVWFSMKPAYGFMHIAVQSVCRYPGYIDKGGYGRSHSGYMYPTCSGIEAANRAAQKTRPDMFAMNYYLYNVLALLMIHDFGRRNMPYEGLIEGNICGKVTSGKTDILATPSGEVAADEQTINNKPFRWRFIENMYGDCAKLILGTIFESAKENILYVCADPYKSNTTGEITTDYKKIAPVPKDGYILDVCLPWIYPKTTTGSSTTGFCARFIATNTYGVSYLQMGGDEKYI